MAIQKSKTLNNGSVGNYWRILQIVVDRESFIVSGRIGLFKDAATSNSGGTHLGLVKNFNFVFNLTEINASSDIISYIYTKILNKANSMITTDIEGNALITPIPFDSDISGGISV